MQMLFEVIFLSFGIVLIVSAAANIHRNMRIKREGILVSATVVDIHRTSKAGKNKSRTQYHPVFEYRVNGNSINYVIPESAYNDLRAGDWGNLTFQGSLFIRFERTYR
jgi:hypothetical protein